MSGQVLVFFLMTTLGSQQNLDQQTSGGRSGTAPTEVQAPAEPARQLPPGDAAPPGTPPVTQTGGERPATLLAANTDEATVKVQLRGLDAEPKDGDLEAGLLLVTQAANLRVHPSVRLVKTERGKPGEFLVTLRISGLVPFGDSSVSLLYSGRQVETLRFFKAGVVPKPAGGEGLVAREAGDPLLLVLENVSTFEYKSVRARLRFDGQDVCDFKVEKFTSSSPVGGADCLDSTKWTPFDIPRYTQVTLSSTPAPAWFIDPVTGLARSGTRNGWLTLRFAGADQAIYEQNIPVEIDFQASETSSFLSIAWVGLPILVGALLSVFLRISLPNLKRRRQLKGQLLEAAKATAGISTAVESNLRVLLRVERLALKEALRSGWWFGPNDSEFTGRVEQALPGLRKRIDAVRQLDAALVRRALLEEQGGAPTRLGQIDDLLDPLVDGLKQDQLSDEDWVAVSQRIEAVGKLLREPNPTEKEAVEALLVGRWQEIRDHFKVDANGKLNIPAALKGLENCFPDPSLLPGNTDAEKDGSKWVKSVGLVRADLQLTALRLLWDFQFLAPAEPAEQRWTDAKTELNKLLATPATDTLEAARLLLRQLASGVSESDIIDALKAGAAVVVLDPQTPSPNQKIRYAVRFRRQDLNTAVAKELVSCHWHFEDQPDANTRPRRWFRRRLTARGMTVHAYKPVSFDEDGWSVYHYFETRVVSSTLSVTFSDSKGNPIALGEAPQWASRTTELREANPAGRWAPLALEAVQLAATVLVPLATLAVTTVNGGNVGHWWQLIGIGFGADTIKNIIAGPTNSSNGG